MTYMFEWHDYFSAVLFSHLCLFILK